MGPWLAMGHWLCAHARARLRVCCCARARLRGVAAGCSSEVSLVAPPCAWTARWALTMRPRRYRTRWRWQQGVGSWLMRARCECWPAIRVTSLARIGTSPAYALPPEIRAALHSKARAASCSRCRASHDCARGAMRMGRQYQARTATMRNGAPHGHRCDTYLACSCRISRGCADR